MIPWETAKFIGTLLSGGLAGAILNALINRRLGSQRQRRLLVSKKLTEYKLPTQKTPKDLKVSYTGVEYESLTLLELSITNNSRITVKNIPFILALPPNTTIVDKGLLETEPVTIGFTSTQPKEAKPDQYYYHIEALHPNDTASLWILLSGPPHSDIRTYYRGDDDVILSPQRTDDRGSDIGDLRALLVVASLFIVVDAGTRQFQEAEAMLEALLKLSMLLAFTHFFMRFYSRNFENRPSDTK